MVKKHFGKGGGGVEKSMVVYWGGGVLRVDCIFFFKGGGGVKYFVFCFWSYYIETNKNHMALCTGTRISCISVVLWVFSITD